MSVPDLEDDWAAIRSVQSPARTSDAAPDADLEGDWATLRSIPEFVYVRRETEEQFQVWRLRVHGQKRFVTANGSLQDYWIVTYDTLLFSYGPPMSTEDANHRYTVPKHAAYPHPDIPAWAQDFNAKTIQRKENQIRLWTEEIADRERWIGAARANIGNQTRTLQAALKTDARTQVRQDLVTVLQRRAENMQKGQELADKAHERWDRDLATLWDEI